ncbi:MAG: filamentous hemagglutinin N-terminal domain-containing protein [Chlamydiota bacterium]
MKKTTHLCAAFLCIAKTLFSLPQDPSIAEGSAQVHHKDKKTMVIKTSEKTIINYKNFNIDHGEKVEFLQPNSSSCVLNRVLGSDGSKILGKIESNGTVFLVNQNGIYFSKDARVNVGSLVASTLNITDENFLQNRFSFSLQDKNRLTEIYNEGFLSASQEGAIVLMAPLIKNAGTIQAHAGHVVLASAEHVTLRFYDDKLLSFAVEGELKDALLEHLGNIQAKKVSMQLPIAKIAIKEIVNHDGIEQGVVFIKENGKILLAAESSIQTQNLSLEGGHLQVQGNIDASSTYAKGGSIRITGQDISLEGAHLNVSGKTGGGTILIGGNFQGKGDLPYASNLSVDNNSILLANAIEQGNGGLIVLWSKESTSFAGTSYAQGGFQEGDGGVVESSSLGDLFISNAYVNTIAPLGNIGTWLLDPTLISISSTGGGVPSGCSTSGNIAVATLEAQASTVTLCANTILQEVPISMSVSGAGLIFQAPVGTVGALTLEYDITTISGPIEITNLETLILGSITLDTTGSGSSGADIVIGRMNTDNNLESLTLTAGLGNVTLNTLGDLNPFGPVTISGSQITLSTLFTSSNPITILGALYVEGEGIISTVASGLGADITLGTVDASSTPSSLTLDAGSAGSISLGDVGSLNPIYNFTLIKASEASVQNITSLSGSINFTTPITLTLPLTTFTILQGDGSSYTRIPVVNGTSPYTQSLTLKTTSRDLISLGETGLITPLNHVVIGSNQSLSVGNVLSSDFTLTSKIGRTTLTGNIATTSSQGVSIETGSLILNGIIETDNISLIAHGSITIGTQRQNILVSSTGQVFINALNGTLGAQNAPVALNTANRTDPIVIGAKALAALSGFSYEKNLIVLDPTNPPCIFIFNKSLISNCNLATRLAFNLLRSSLFINSYFNGQRLGFGPLRQLGPLFISSYYTEDFPLKVEIPVAPEETKCQGQSPQKKPVPFPLQK